MVIVISCFSAVNFQNKVSHIVTRGRDNNLHIENVADGAKDLASIHHVNTSHAGNIDNLLSNCSLEMQK